MAPPRAARRLSARGVAAPSVSTASRACTLCAEANASARNRRHANPKRQSAAALHNAGASSEALKTG
jgi:hypothetical protein